MLTNKVVQTHAVIKARAIYMLEMKNAKDLSKTYIKKNV
jgi:hypothetical protein